MTVRWMLIALAIANILLFQNCSSPESKFNGSSGTAGLPSSQASGNGQPYDGKIYVALGEVCSDGTQVSSRIILNTPTSATLVRDHCQNITPVVLSNADFQLNAANGDQLIYAQKIFTAEAPPVQLSKVMTWNYQLTGTLGAPAAQIFDVDMFGTTKASIQSLKAAGYLVICNIPAGAFENGRPDAASFNAIDIGNRLFAGSQDRWLDTRSISVRSLILARLDLGKSKGCDGIDFDSVDAYTSNSGFPLTASTQIDFNQFLAFAAHDRSLLVALNNVPGLATALVHSFDFAITEQCYQDGSCGSYQAFTDLGKPVLNAEYTAFSPDQCLAAKNSSISLTYFSANLDGTRRETCP